MPLSTVDNRSALIVVDLQKGITAMPAAHPIPDIVSRAATLAAAFRRHGLPVVLVNVDGVPPGRTEASRSHVELPEGWTELAPELGRQEQDHLVTKRTWGAFTNTGLEEYLKRQGVTEVVIVGVATSAGVESTARHAHELGFHVALVTDAMTDRSSEAHAHSITNIFPRLGETGTTQDVLDLLDRRTA